MILKVEDVMVEDVITVDSYAPVMEAVELMNKHEIGCLIVVRGGKAVGIVTERDLLKRVLAKSRDPKRLRFGRSCRSLLSLESPTWISTRRQGSCSGRRSRSFPWWRRGGSLAW